MIPAIPVGVGMATYSPTADGGLNGNSYVTDNRGTRIASRTAEGPDLGGPDGAARSFYADLANGVAIMDAICAWIRSEFDEQCRAEMMRQIEERRRCHASGS